MNSREINKIIADYMGWQFNHFENEVILVVDGEIQNMSDLYTDSLDALVPVWEKLDKNITIHCRHSLVDCAGLQFKGTTIAEAAALATVKAIKGLENE